MTKSDDNSQHMSTTGYSENIASNVLCAFFSLTDDKNRKNEIAIDSNLVVEVIHPPKHLLFFSNGVDYLEGIFDFHGQLIPMVNLKKRLDFADVSYDHNMRIAVVDYCRRYFGLMVDGITAVEEVPDQRRLQLEDRQAANQRVISSFIKKNDSASLVKHLRLDKLLSCRNKDIQETATKFTPEENDTSVPEKEKSLLFYTINNQLFASYINDVQEVSEQLEINEAYKNNFSLGTVRLRNEIVPIIDTSLLFGDNQQNEIRHPNSKIITFTHKKQVWGFVVDQLIALESVNETHILPVSPTVEPCYKSICVRDNMPDAIILCPVSFISMYGDNALQVTSGINTGRKDDVIADSYSKDGADPAYARDSYLHIQAGIPLAVNLDYVREFISYSKILTAPGDNPGHGGIINWHGEIIPLVHLHDFFSLPVESDPDDLKVIVVSNDVKTVALTIEKIITILRRQKVYSINSVRPDLVKWQPCFTRILNIKDVNGKCQHLLKLNIDIFLDEYLT